MPGPAAEIPPSLRTERLILRRWRDADREPFAAMNADPVVMEHFPSLQSRAVSDGFVDRIDALIAAQGWGLWALEIAEGPQAGRFAGFTGLLAPSWEAAFTPCVEIGWRLPRWAWGQGYASEAARAALEVGFDRAGLTEIVSLTTVANTRSRAVMQRLGMTHDPADDFDHPALPADSPVLPHVLYRLSVEAWRARPTGS